MALDDVDFQVNITDFQLLKEACTHPKLHAEIAIQMMDVLGKIYLNSIIFHKPAYQQL